MTPLIFIAFFVQIFVLLYFIAINGTYTMLTILAFIEVRRQRQRAFIDDYAYLLRSKLAPGVSILVPCHNEEPTIVESVHSLLTVRFPRMELVVINDGSEDGTLEALVKAFKLVKVSRVLRDTPPTRPVRAVYKSPVDPRLVVIDKDNGGKADSLNAGLGACHMPYFVSIDADVVLEGDALLRVMKPIVDEPQTTVAAGGIIRIVNDCEVRGGQVIHPRLSRKSLVLFQIIEYLRAFTAGRAGYSKMNSLVLISGAFGVFSCDLIRRIGGYDTETVGEDMEVLVRLHGHLRREKRKYRVFFAAYPICWTEAPETLKLLGRQRSRWQRGLSEAMWKHKTMILNPRYGRIGVFSMAASFLFEWLGPIVEAGGYAYFIFTLVTGQITGWFFLIFLSIAVFWGMLLSIAAVAMQDIELGWYQRWPSMLRLLVYAFLEDLGYRQLTVVWRLRGLFAWITKRKGWGAMPRKGFAAPKKAA